MRTTLSSKIAALSLLLSGAATSTVVGFVVWDEGRDDGQRLTARRAEIAELASGWVSSELASGDVAGLERLVSRLTHSPGVLYAAVYDARGVKIASSADAELPPALERPAAPSPPGGMTSRTRPASAGRETYRDLVTTIGATGPTPGISAATPATAGYLQLGPRDRPLRDRMRMVTAARSAVALAACAVSGFATLLVARRL